MKKTTFLLLFVLFTASISYAQSATINNTSNCSVTFHLVASDAGTCDLAYTSSNIVLAPGSSLTISDPSSISWQGAAPGGGILWGKLVVQDDLAGYTLAEVGTSCTSDPTSASYASPCDGNEVDIIMTDNIAGLTVNIITPDNVAG